MGACPGRSLRILQKKAWSHGRKKEAAARSSELGGAIPED